MSIRVWPLTCRDTSGVVLLLLLLLLLTLFAILIVLLLFLLPGGAFLKKGIRGTVHSRAARQRRKEDPPRPAD
jgi:hypothetical protein